MRVANYGERVTQVTTLPGLPLHGVVDAEVIAALGIQIVGNQDCVINATTLGVPLRGVVIDNRGEGNEFYFGNSAPTETLAIRIRCLGSACQVVFPELPPEILRLNDIFLREGAQTLFWGRNSTAVGVSIELAGDGATLTVGDDCMFSSDIWLRNFDMHSIFDINTGAVLNEPQRMVRIERHVWFGADAAMLRGNVGYGSIIAARALVTSDIPQTALAGGMPARVLREGVSWTRDIGGDNGAVREMLAGLR